MSAGIAMAPVYLGGEDPASILSNLLMSLAGIDGGEVVSELEVLGCRSGRTSPMSLAVECSTTQWVVGHSRPSMLGLMR